MTAQVTTFFGIAIGFAAKSTKTHYEIDIVFLFIDIAIYVEKHEKR